MKAHVGQPKRDVDMLDNFIYEHWKEKAEKEGSSPEASWGDLQMMELEISNIRAYIKEGFRILDAGCGNGYSTTKLFSKDSMNFLTAFDFVPEMVANARRRFQAKTFRSLQFNIYQADIREIPEEENAFDLSYTIRVLINLATWADQMQGIEEIIRVTRPNGLIILSEAFWGSLQKLNALRIIAGLEPLGEHDFNKYLNEHLLENYLSQRGLRWEVNHFSSLYYLGTRFIRELNPFLPDGFDKGVNRDFHALSKKYNGGDFGIQKQYIIRKGK